MFKAIITIIRPINVVISMASVYLGGLISFDSYYSSDLLWAALSAGLIAGFGNTANDIFDIEIDRRNKSYRPLPSSMISIKTAIALATVLAISGLLIAATINLQCLFIASAVIVALLIYTPYYKGNGYWGNLLISLISALAFFFGAAAIGNIMGGLIPAVLAFLFHFIREIIKDMEDYEADKAEDVQTGAVKFGFEISRTVAIINIITLIAATLSPYIQGIYGFAYLIVVILGIHIFLLYFIARLITSPGHKTYHFIAVFMKALMPIGILAVFIGSRGY
ncbi:MAG: UbiA family prenyltransferase [candidate division Zixibacteria bacterium]|nr:UbiA family prenyltransferase [candidate division Zixibacteria bacterium]